MTGDEALAESDPMAVAPQTKMKKPAADRPLLSDFWRACLGVFLGLLGGLAFGLLLKPPHILIVFGALVVGPTLFVALLFNLGRETRGLAITRTVGAVAGLLVFLALFLDEGLTRPIYATRSPGLVLMIFGGIALTLIAVGLVTSNLAWSCLPADDGR